MCDKGLDSILDEFEEEWKSARSNNERRAFLKATICLLAGFPTLDQDLAVPVLKKITGIGKTIIRQALKEARRDMRRKGLV